MKRIVLLILMILFSTISIFAQNRTTIYGNVGVENANIRVLNTQYGTSSDVKGNYSFSIKSDKDIKLLYSCIGYQDTTIMIRHKELKKDSVNISFEMRPLLCTTSEIRKESDYKQLEAFISRTYTLERDIENQCTYVADGYFGLHLNNE